VKVSAAGVTVTSAHTGPAAARAVLVTHVDGSVKNHVGKRTTV
jgi:hypothetical protein